MRDIVLLDGGMGQELIRRSPDDPTPLWSARVMLDHPNIVQAVHEDYLRAGAQLVTLNAYSVTRCRLSKHGIEAEFAALQRSAIACAEAARQAAGAEAKLAGCLPPFDWSYQIATRTPDEAAPLYAEIARLQAPHVDVILCETMSSVRDAEGALRGAAAAGKPIWLALSVDDEDGTRLRSGESLSDAIRTLISKHSLAAILVNCSRPEAVDQAMPALQDSGLRFGAYANGFTSVSALDVGTTVDALGARKDLGPQEYAEFAMGWVRAGASIVGGCCEVGPAHIAELKQRLEVSGYRITGGF